MAIQTERYSADFDREIHSEDFGHTQQWGQKGAQPQMAGTINISFDQGRYCPRDMPDIDAFANLVLNLTGLHLRFKLG
jgi:hypothetical protein